MKSPFSGMVTCLLLGALLAATQASAQEHTATGGGHAMHGAVAAMDSGPGAGKKGCKHHGKGARGDGQHGGMKGHHGSCAKHGKRGGGATDGHRLYGAHWKQGLTVEQQSELDRLHLELARIKAPLTAGIKALKVRLAVLATSDSAGANEIDGPLMDLLLAEQELMRAKNNYIAAQRKVLTPEQRVSFDMEVIHKAMHGGKDDHKGGHGRH